MLRHGDYSTARNYLEESIPYSQAANDRLGVISARDVIGICDLEQGQYQGAREAFENKVKFGRQTGDKKSICTGLINLGDTACIQGDFAAAKAFLQECINLACDIGSRSIEYVARCDLGLAACEMDDYELARSCLEECLEVNPTNVRRGTLPLLGVAYVVAHDSLLSDHTSQVNAAVQAASLLAFVDTARGAMGIPISIFERRIHDKTLARLHQTLGEDNFAKAWEKGRILTWEAARIEGLEKIRST